MTSQIPKDNNMTICIYLYWPQWTGRVLEKLPNSPNSPTLLNSPTKFAKQIRQTNPPNKSAKQIRQTNPPNKSAKQIRQTSQTNSPNYSPNSPNSPNSGTSAIAPLPRRNYLVIHINVYLNDGRCFVGLLL